MARLSLLRTCSLVALTALGGCAVSNDRPAPMGRHLSIKDDPADFAPRAAKAVAPPAARPVQKIAHAVPMMPDPQATPAPSSPPAKPELPAPRLPKADAEVQPAVRIIVDPPAAPKVEPKPQVVEAPKAPATAVVTPEPAAPSTPRAPVVIKPSEAPSATDARPSTEMRRKAPEKAPDVTPPQPPKMAAVPPPTIAPPSPPAAPASPPVAAPAAPSSPPVAPPSPPVAKVAPPTVAPAPPVAQPVPVTPPVAAAPAAPAPASKADPKADAKPETKIAALTEEQRTAATLQRADQYMKASQVQNARTYLEDAAKTGNAKVLAALAETYDPLVLREQYPRLARTGDPEKAIALYEQAKAKGATGLDARITALKTLAGPKR